MNLYLDILDATEHCNVYLFCIEFFSDFKRLGGYGFSIEIINVMTNLLYDDKIEFYTNPFLLGFDSQVYDLRDGAFREYKPDNYILMSVGFDIDRKNREKEKEELINIIKDIAGDQAPFLLKLFARTLFGKELEKLPYYEDMEEMVNH